MNIVRGVGRSMCVTAALLLLGTSCKEEKKASVAAVVKSKGTADLEITLLKAYAEYDKVPAADKDRAPHEVYVFRIRNLSGANQNLFKVDSNGYYDWLNTEILSAPVADSLPMTRLNFSPVFDNLQIKPFDSVVVYGYGSKISIPPFIAKNLLIRSTDKSVFLFRYNSPDTLIEGHRRDYKLIQKSTQFAVDTLSTEPTNFKTKIRDAETGK
ncbi:MAG: hypothetical protein ACHQRM_14010 [Bacteroidia bacterium]